MYYLIQGKAKDGSNISFDWVIKANSQEEAIEDAKKDLTDNDVIEEITELTVEQCIAKENENIEYDIEEQYIRSRCDFEHVSVKEYSKMKKEFKSSRENYYEALKEANRKLSLFRWAERVLNIDDMTVKELKEVLNLVLSAKTDDELWQTRNTIYNKYGKKERM